MRLSDDDLRYLEECACDAALAAGRIIATRRPETIDVKTGGNSYASQVVTEVDRAAETCILELLKTPLRRFDLGVLSEEHVDDGSRLDKEFFWSIDPLDGTLFYIESEPGYAVSVALVGRDGSPIIGAVYDPWHDQLYSAAMGLGASLNRQVWTTTPATVNTSLSVFTDQSFAASADYEPVTAALAKLAHKMGLEGVVMHDSGGAVINACNVLRTPSSCYFKFPKPQLGGGSLWDFAATACLFSEARAIATDMHGKCLDLNRRDGTFMNHRGVLFASDRELADELRALYRRRCAAAL